MDHHLLSYQPTSVTILASNVYPAKIRYHPKRYLKIEIFIRKPSMCCHLEVSISLHALVILSLVMVYFVTSLFSSRCQAAGGSFLGILCPGIIDDQFFCHCIVGGVAVLGSPVTPGSWFCD